VGVNKVLVSGRQFASQKDVQAVDDDLLTLHLSVSNHRNFSLPLTLGEGRRKIKHFQWITSND
jgi:hypothetical protein